MYVVSIIIITIIICITITVTIIIIILIIIIIINIIVTIIISEASGPLRPLRELARYVADSYLDAEIKQWTLFQR